MWSKKYSSYIEDKKRAEFVIDKVSITKINIGDMVLYDNKPYKVKELWVTDFGPNNVDIKLELDDEYLEGYSINLSDVVYGEAANIIYEKD